MSYSWYVLWYTDHSVVYTCDLILARIWLLGLCSFINRVVHRRRSRRDGSQVCLSGAYDGRTEHLRLWRWLKSDSGSEWKFCGKSKPVIHYPIFISTKTRKQSQVSLFSKRIPISILFTTLSIYFTLCLPRQWRQKCLMAPTNVT